MPITMVTTKHLEIQGFQLWVRSLGGAELGGSSSGALVWFQTEARAGRVGKGVQEELGADQVSLRTPPRGLSVRGPHSVAASGQLDCFLGNSVLHMNKEEAAL